MCYTHHNRMYRGADINAPVSPVLRGVSAAERLRIYAPPGDPDECWNWTRALSKGYGNISVDGKSRSAHIVAWELANDRKLPAGMMILHTCDNPPCCNPAHLVLGTHTKNMVDMVARSRQARGTKQGSSKLTEDEVREIRELHASGLGYRKIAKQYGVVRSTIEVIVRGKGWVHVD